VTIQPHKIWRNAGLSYFFASPSPLAKALIVYTIFMRIAIFSDIHANLEALEAVLADAEAQGCDSYICLGDVVGYNADPAACLERAVGNVSAHA